MIVPNENFRLDPTRAIYVSGVINDELITRLTPEIIRLHHSAKTPISVYIDSPGGLISSMETILNLLRSPSQGTYSPCKIITAATVNAGSAAADLLSSGDYAVAYPNATILYHGVRTFERNPLTLEYTSMLTTSPKSGNDRYAMELARKTEDRFTFRYIFARSEFDKIRKDKNSPALSELDCFIEIIGAKLSREANKVWAKAKDRYGRYEDLLDSVMKQYGKRPGPRTLVDLEAEHLRALITLELKSNRKDPTWTFSEGGIERLVEDFYLLTEYMTNYGSERLKRWCTTFGRWMVPAETLAEIELIVDEAERVELLVENVRPMLQPIWSFFVALCHALQEGENRLTATDAYWLGLVDEVIGKDLMSLRIFEEFKPDPAVGQPAAASDTDA